MAPFKQSVLAPSDDVCLYFAEASLMPVAEKCAVGGSRSLVWAVPSGIVTELEESNDRSLRKRGSQ